MKSICEIISVFGVYISDIEELQFSIYADLSWHAGLQCQELWSVQLAVPASKENVFPGCERASTER